MLSYATVTRATRTARAGAEPPRRATPQSRQARLDAELLGLLVTTWAVRTGRTPPARPPQQLTAEELIEFWSDDHTAGGKAS
ncbi:hypothetical protein [Sphaerisporangium rhizosphaerae]|uniref:Uncharacterized protein n=1 Tax=Sphaerisporangium rhizosphaerae TaxID=2269375 RepID=A0ABW2NZ14_9ACTN